MPKEDNNGRMSEPELHKIHCCVWRGDRVKGETTLMKVVLEDKELAVSMASGASESSV